ncbi:MAG: lysine 2,3-aminomutase, partial [Flammeovirgaceae bacterium]
MIEEYTLKYRSFGVNNFRESGQFQKYLNEDQKRAIEVVGKVLPFKINSYVIEELINWQDVPNDPIFRLTVPHKDMLNADAFEKLDYLLAKDPLGKDTASLIEKLRLNLNPHPANQLTDNIPYYEGEKLQGIQHKYRETLLFFPSHGQTCHSYCSFCFRWPQFVGIDDLKFASSETQMLVNYLKANSCITDVLITGGDPLIMSARRLREYIIPLLR